jgi:hypothetical protein
MKRIFVQRIEKKKRFQTSPLRERNKTEHSENGGTRICVLFREITEEFEDTN